MNNNKNTISLADNEKKEKVIKITFEYDLEILFRIRSMPGRVYYSDPPVWSVPVSIEAVEQLQKWGFTIAENLKSFIEKAKEKKADISINGIPGLKGKPMPFQNVGIAFIEDKRGRALIADEMGLGKTIQALAWLQLHREKKPVIIVVPASLKLNWQREAETWLTDPKTEILSGTKVWKTTGDILIVNYDVLFAWVPELKKRKPQILILDEAHAIKSSTAKKTKSVKRLSKGIPHIIALSGTPIINRPTEIFNAVKIIIPDLFPTEKYFSDRFGKGDHLGNEYEGHANEYELNRILTSTIMIRRKKSDVLTELPDKMFSFVPIELTNENEYKIAEKDFVSFVRQVKGDAAAERIRRFEALAKVEGLKQLTIQGKMKQSIEWIKDFLESGEKLVIFCTHKIVIEKLMEEFKAVKIDGSVSLKERQKAVDDFQNDPNTNLFIGNIKAAGEGITLTAASNVVILELPWSPKTIDQASDRCHRIGQKNSVTVYYLLASGTIEDRIAKLLDKKRKVIDATIDREETEQESLLSELMKEYE